MAASVACTDLFESNVTQIKSVTVLLRALLREGFMSNSISLMVVYVFYIKSQKWKLPNFCSTSIKTSVTALIT